LVIFCGSGRADSREGDSPNVVRRSRYGVSGLWLDRVPVPDVLAGPAVVNDASGQLRCRGEHPDYAINEPIFGPATS
jgi:hypothetical protein